MIWVVYILAAWGAMSIAASIYVGVANGLAERRRRKDMVQFNADDVVWTAHGGTLR